MTNPIKTTDDIVQYMINTEAYFDLYNFLSPIIAAGLRKVKECNKGVPFMLVDDIETWQEALEEMIWAFDTLTYESDFDADDNRIQRGLDLFAKHYRSLWV
jgi:hypothetical protein